MAPGKIDMTTRSPSKAGEATSQAPAPWDDPHWLRTVAAEVTAVLLRCYGAHQLDIVEDAVQEALMSAMRVWPLSGLPKNATGWLVLTARNRLLDGFRRTRREQTLSPRDEWSDDMRDAMAGVDPSPLADDQVLLLFACCHPSLSPESRVALTLKTVAQLSVEEIARALQADDRAVAQRLVRAKKTLRAQRAEWRLPVASELPSRLSDVLSVCYAMFGEGHSATDGNALVRIDLCHEAIRLLERLVAWPATATPETHALLALCCFAAARVPARLPSAADVAWTSLADQDRARWDQALIARGLRAFGRAAAGPFVTRYHLEAEIASRHSLAATWADTPWPAIIDAYTRLLEILPSRTARLARAIAVAESGDLTAAWDALEQLGREEVVDAWLNWLVAYAEIAHRRGDQLVARDMYEKALRLPMPDPTRRHLTDRVGRIGG
jgi:RNA polymerase sigma-70 factor, ECF subfamily